MEFRKSSVNDSQTMTRLGDFTNETVLKYRTD